MSKATIAAQNTVIRNETQDYANTRGRVADVLDDLNNSKPDTIEVEDMIEEALEDFDLTTKINKPNWSGTTQFYFVKSDPLNDNLQQINLDALRSPYWTGSNFANSPLFVSSDGLRIGIGAASVSERLEVSGNVKANALILPANATSAVANRFRSDGSFVFYSNSSSVEKRLAFIDNTLSVFDYTPTGNFNLSTIKTLIENQGLIFNGIHIIIKIGSNNYNCSIDIGTIPANQSTIITVGKRGTGSISFIPVNPRTLTATDAVTVLNGNAGSGAKIDIDVSTDVITIRNT